MSFNLDVDDEFEVFSGKNIRSKKIGMGLSSDAIDMDLTSPVKNVINRSQKSKMKNGMGKPLVLGDERISDLDPIAAGQKRILNPDRRRKKIRPLKKGAKFIRKNLRR